MSDVFLVSFETTKRLHTLQMILSFLGFKGGWHLWVWSSLSEFKLVGKTILDGNEKFRLVWANLIRK